VTEVGYHRRMDHVAELFDWLVDGAPGAKTSPEVVTRLATGLCAGGVPVDRAAAFVTTLHPNVLGRAFQWRPDEPVRVFELTQAIQQSEVFTKSPVAEIMANGREVRTRTTADAEYAVIRELHAEGFTDFVGLPLAFLSGETHVITFATKREGGFTDEHLSALRHVTRPLSRVAEILALRRTAATFLSTYVGRNSGDRILAGRICKGDIETIRAVIWFSDLRGFTAMSSVSTPREVIDALNELFEYQVPAIEKRGGEVLKFIGDGLLAIFPCADLGATAAQCEAALEAADAVFAALDERNRTAARRLEIGVALHVGEIAYGNIGGASRLDFTAIGAAVNVAARLEGVTSKLGRRLVVSGEVAEHVKRPLDSLGSLELKGVSGPQPVFAPKGT
jgi:adenylate cyclase